MLASHTTINADFYSETHRISCRLVVGPTGLIGMLNDNNTSLVEVENAYFSRLQQPAKILSHFDKASLYKANLMFVLLNRREDLGPVGLARAGYSQYLLVSVMVTTPTFEIQGQVEVPGKFDAGALLVGGTGRFTPVYKASAVSTVYPDTAFTGEVIVLNRTLVEALAPIPKGKA